MYQYVFEATGFLLTNFYNRLISNKWLALWLVYVFMGFYVFKGKPTGRTLIGSRPAERDKCCFDIVQWTFSYNNNRFGYTGYFMAAELCCNKNSKMKIIVTGSLGHISKPLTTRLVKQGHAVTVISSQPAKQKDIEVLGASAAIGSLEDVGFLTTTFTGADAVYCMVPPNNYFDPGFDLIAHYRRLGHNYAQAIEQSGVKRVVNLSTIGAHLDKGNGILLGAHDVQNILNKLPSDISITHMRPTSFYYNLFAYVEMIKAAGVIAVNYGADNIIPWVSPVDIADAVAEELVRPFTGRKIRYVASEELTGHETARILGAAIGKPDLKWILVSDEEVQRRLEGIGMNKQIAAGLVEMYASLHSGLLAESYNRHKPEQMGKVKLKDFAVEFAAAFAGH